MTSLSRDERFKIWRSKQSYFMNTLIGIALFIKDMLILIGMATVALAVIGLIALFLIQVTVNAIAR